MIGESIWPCILALDIVPHSWALPIILLELKVIMNTKKYANYETYEGEGFYPYTLRVGGILHLHKSHINFSRVVGRHIIGERNSSMKSGHFKK